MNEIKQYRKKPVVIEAIQWNGRGNIELAMFLNGNDWKHKEPTNTEPEKLIIKTLEGNITASIGDWIIKGVKGEFYPIKDDIFKATYEPVELATRMKPEPVELSKLPASLAEWKEAAKHGTSGDMVFDILADWENSLSQPEPVAPDKVKEAVAGIIFCKLNCNLRRDDCNKDRHKCKVVFRQEKKQKGWPYVLADDIHALYAPLIEAAEANAREKLIADGWKSPEQVLAGANMVREACNDRARLLAEEVEAKGRREALEDLAVNELYHAANHLHYCIREHDWGKSLNKHDADFVSSFVREYQKVVNRLFALAHPEEQKIKEKK